MWQNLWCLLFHRKYHRKVDYPSIKGHKLFCKRCPRGFDIYE